MLDDFVLTHQQIRERQAVLSASFAAESLSTIQYVDAMNELNAELKVAEEKMYAAADCVVKSQKMRMFLDHSPVLRFITNTMPPAFKKIHARFPHLTFDEVIAFEQTVREAGGSRMTHSGVYVPTKRMTYADESVPRYHYDTYVSWSCCHSISFDQRERKYDIIGINGNDVAYGIYSGCKVDLGSKVEYRPRESYEQISTPLSSIDLKNPDPCGRCDNPSLFSLIDEPEGQKNECTIAEIKLATQAQIDKIEAEISELRRKAGHFDDLLKTLDALSD